MPHLMHTHTGEVMEREAKTGAPFGPGFSQEQIDASDSMQVWGSSFSDPGGDYVEFKLFNGEKVVAERRLAGY
jgi:hypothetical protein